MKKTLFLFLVIIFFSNYRLKAQQSDTISSPSLLGFALGTSTGFGLTYRNVAYKFGGQFTLGSNYNDISVGITPIFMVRRDKIANLFIYNGNHFYYIPERQRYTITNGIGLGVDINTQTPVMFSFMIGAASYSYSYAEWRSGITLEIALLYRMPSHSKKK